MCTDSQFIFTIQLLLNAPREGICLTTNSYPEQVQKSSSMPFIFREQIYRRSLLLDYQQLLYVLHLLQTGSGDWVLLDQQLLHILLFLLQVPG
jgi:hypothetical protein